MRWLFAIIIMACMNYAIAFEIKKVDVYCDGQKACSYYEKNKSELIRKYSSFEEFMSIFKIYFSKENFRSFEYKILKSELTVSLKEKKKIRKINLIGAKGKLRKNLLKKLEIKRNTFYKSSSLKKSLAKIKKELISRGYENASLDFTLKEQEQTLDIDLNINLGELRKVSGVIIRCNEKVNEMVMSIIKPVENKAFNRVLFSKYRDEVQEALLSQGYYFARPVFKQLKNSSSFMLECGSLKRVALQINDEGEEFNKEKMYLSLRKYLASSGRGFSENLLRKVVSDILKKEGYSDREFVLEREVDFEDNNLEHIKIILKKGDKLKISDLSFKGNRFHSDRILGKLFYKTNSMLIAENLWDEAYFKSFQKVLKDHYIQSGFLTPRIKVITNKKKAEIAYSIEEGVRTRVRSFKVRDENKIPLLGFFEFYKYEKNQVFNPIEFGKALKNFKQSLLTKGYYYSVMESTEREIVTFNPNNSLVDINLNFNVGQKVMLKEFTYIGLEATKKVMLEKTLGHFRDKTLTPLLVKRIRRRLGNLNLFKNYKVNVLLSEDKKNANIAVKLEEKKYGLLELSPGFRTDLGVKLSSRYLRENIMGKGQILDVGVQSNYRLHLNDLALFRQEVQQQNIPGQPTIFHQPKRFLEYLLKASYTYPYFLGTNWDNFSNLSFSKSRFYGFDANIFRISNTIKRNYNQNIGFTGTYQFEWIEQENSTEYWSGNTDDGKFRIGSLIPSLIFDYRDNPIFPRKGFHIQLSYEISKSFLGSMVGDKDCSFNTNSCPPKVDFGKIVTRSKFYYPITKKLYLASSLAFGYANNGADKIKVDSSGNTVVDSFGVAETEGYIPTIKAFRLSGIDLVRGYSERDINLIDFSNDVEQERISNSAYLTNFKFESRFSLTDSLTLAGFFDAGSIQVNRFRPFDLRTSVGLSLKYLTPVGTIDIDYGVKLRRRTTVYGKESPGEFRLSIGFF